ncbi:putative aminoacrylate hydrolase RutD [Austwickia sp. TVS 96-490-7B]|uniref:alpha/beta fold hydrolase n=1 Tax=Austwickia sp. TVS 96-490-7B TaxID=2830843 RepID=UPI001D3B3C62|nr:alpha/beta hydrolase [Austwickia sp. TVS 96-490-7B]MBW3085653.1 putative aminoacrylate hydrolase RutD [Austwickia sp. TVS 96-490-7B]
MSSPGPARPVGLTTVRHLTGLGLGLVAAGITAAAGVAADRLSKDRRLALALDETTGGGRGASYVDIPDHEHVVLASDGVPLHVEVDEPRGQTADRKPLITVVLSHGYCLSLRCWVFQRRALRAAGYRVVLWDQRGHGRSGSGATDSYHIDQLGRDLHAVIEEVAPHGPLVLVGHSMGGMTMMALALEASQIVRDRVVGAAFVATSTGGLASVSYGLGAAAGKAVHAFGPAAAGGLARMQSLVDGTVRLGKDVVNFLVDWGSFDSPVPMSIAELTTDMIFATRMEVISALMPHFDRHDKREALTVYHGIETLVINGLGDRLTPPAHSEEIVRLLPGAEHVVVENAGHVIMLEHPSVLDEQLLELAGRAQRAAADELATCS